MINKIISKGILSNNFFRVIRNNINFKPSIIFKPDNLGSPISDFFYWENTQDIQTKFCIFNLASHAIPEEKIIDEVEIYIYNSYGDLNLKKNIILQHNESVEFFFNNLSLRGFGSFLIFHNFAKSNKLIQTKTHIADRGYAGYKKSNGLWNFVHGNNYACSLENNKRIKPLLARTFFQNYYEPQVSFGDVKSFNIILNNPSYKKLNIRIECYDKRHKKILDEYVIIHPFNTKKILFDDLNIDNIKLFSKLLFCRPLIYKIYDSYFDIFHS